MVRICPEYPGLAIRNGYQGTVTLQITVDAAGIVSDVQVKKSSSYKILDDSALDHVRKHLRLRNPPGEIRIIRWTSFSSCSVETAPILHGQSESGPITLRQLDPNHNPGLKTSKQLPVIC